MVLPSRCNHRCNRQGATPENARLHEAISLLINQQVMWYVVACYGTPLHDQTGSKPVTHPTSSFKKLYRLKGLGGEGAFPVLMRLRLVCALGWDAPWPKGLEEGFLL
jgi:hypothetical protein